jgi:hypothetical protein
MVKQQGYFPEEIAQEFAAFISLVTRRRVFDSHSNRLGNWPIEDEQQPYRRPPRQEPQRLREIDPERIYMLLEHLRVLDRSTAEGFVLAMRLYHAAIEAMYSDPEAAYLLLVMTLEAVSSIVNRGYKPDADEFLDSRFPGWRAFTPSGNIEAMKATLLANEHYAFRKLVKFVEDNAPATFWTDTHDDAKPTSMRTDLQPWERIEKAKLRASLRSVYDARSGLTHTGARLPPSIVLGHLPLVPTAAVVEGLASSVGEGPVKLPVPPLLTVERLVSQCMVTYLERSAPVTDEV